MPNPRKLFSHLWQLARRRPLITVLVLAAALRILVVCWKFENLSTDTDSYLAIAKNLLAGEGFCSVPGQPTAYRPPLYPFFVAVSLLFGGTLGLAATQIVLGTATSGLAWQFAGRLQLSERARVLTSLMVAVDPLLLLYTSHAMTETLITFLVTLLLVLAAGEKSNRRSIGVGIVFGLTVLCRPSLWAFGGLAAGICLLQRFRKVSDSEAKRESARDAALLLAGLLVTIAPWTIRNWLVLGRPIVMTTHGGYTLLLANNPVFYEEVVEQGDVWQRPSLGRWQKSVDLALLDQGISKTDELARDTAMRQMATDNIRQSPGQFARSCVTRALRLWSPGPQAGTTSPIKRWVVTGWYMVVFSLFAVGFVRIRRINKNVWLGLVLVVSLTGVHAVFWSNARMRAPLTAVLATIAASAVFQQKTDLDCGAESA